MTRYEEYLIQLNKLASGTLDPTVASKWAVEEEQKLDESRVMLNAQEQEIIDMLQIASVLNEKGSYLYGVDDFKQWISDLNYE